MRVALDRQRALRPSAVAALDSSTLPFVRPKEAAVPVERPVVVRIDDLELAFPNEQVGGTRLVLTQSTYLIQKWVDVVGVEASIIATADATRLARGSPEAFQGRGPWRWFHVLDVSSISIPGDDPRRTPDRTSLAAASAAATKLLVRAYGSPDVVERMHLCRDAAAIAPDSAVVALALASACREQQDLIGARAALESAARLAPDWEAVYYEDGKCWLASDEIQRACDAFQRACDLMPTFSAAFSNLGATLGELDRPEAALAALEQALVADPDRFVLLNNIGVVKRELGRLDQSEATFRRVVEIAPEFVFGYYNLGHTAFLRGRYREALAAYEEGQRRDPQKNSRQGCRLAIVRFANGDVEGAERDLRRFIDAASPEEREDLLLEAYEIVHALIRTEQNFAGRQPFLDRISVEITRSRQRGSNA